MAKLKNYLSFLKENPGKSFSYIKKPKFVLNHMFNLFGLNARFVDLQTIVLYVNSTCNLKCKMCDVGQKNKIGIDKLRESQKNTNLSPALLAKLLDDPYIKKKKIHFNLLMTEPLLHPQIGDIVKMIKDKGHTVNITTNGYLLSTKAKAIASAGVDSVQVSMDGPEEINDMIRGVSGAYKNAIEGIRELKKSKNLKVSINYAVTSMNDSKIIEFLEAIDKEEVKVDLVKLQFMVFISKEMLENHNNICDIKQTESCLSEEVHPSKVDLTKLSNQLKSIKKYNNIGKVEIIPDIKEENELERYFNIKGNKIKDNAKCFFPWDQFAFTTDGKILIHMRCFNFFYGDFNKEDIKTIFNNKRISDFREKLKKADFCFPACTRCCGVMRP